MNISIEQAFTVPFRYQVCFSEGIFEPSNTLLVDLIAKDRKSKVFFVIDSGVAEAHPSLVTDIQTYSAAHLDRFILCASPLIVQGGEASKNDHASYEQIVEATHIHGRNF